MSGSLLPFLHLLPSLSKASWLRFLKTIEHHVLDEDLTHDSPSANPQSPETCAAAISAALLFCAEIEREVEKRTETTNVPKALYFNKAKTPIVRPTSRPRTDEEYRRLFEYEFAQLNISPAVLLEVNNTKQVVSQVSIPGKLSKAIQLYHPPGRIFGQFRLAIRRCFVSLLRIRVDELLWMANITSRHVASTAAASVCFPPLFTSPTRTSDLIFFGDEDLSRLPILAGAFSLIPNRSTIFATHPKPERKAYDWGNAISSTAGAEEDPHVSYVSTKASEYDVVMEDAEKLTSLCPSNGVGLINALTNNLCDGNRQLALAQPRFQFESAVASQSLVFVTMPSDKDLFTTKINLSAGLFQLQATKEPAEVDMKDLPPEINTMHELLVTGTEEQKLSVSQKDVDMDDVPDHTCHIGSEHDDEMVITCTTQLQTQPHPFNTTHQNADVIWAKTNMPNIQMASANQIPIHTTMLRTFPKYIQENLNEAKTTSITSNLPDTHRVSQQVFPSDISSQLRTRNHGLRSCQAPSHLSAKQRALSRRRQNGQEHTLDSLILSTFKGPLGGVNLSMSPTPSDPYPGLRQLEELSRTDPGEAAKGYYASFPIPVPDYMWKHMQQWYNDSDLHRWRAFIMKDYPRKMANDKELTLREALTAVTYRVSLVWEKTEGARKEWAGCAVQNSTEWAGWKSQWARMHPKIKSNDVWNHMVKTSSNTYDEQEIGSYQAAMRVRRRREKKADDFFLVKRQSKQPGVKLQVKHQSDPQISPHAIPQPTPCTTSQPAPGPTPQQVRSDILAHEEENKLDKLPVEVPEVTNDEDFPRENFDWLLEDDNSVPEENDCEGRSVEQRDIALPHAISSSISTSPSTPRSATTTDLTSTAGSSVFAWSSDSPVSTPPIPSRACRAGTKRTATDAGWESSASKHHMKDEDDLRAMRTRFLSRLAKRNHSEITADDSNADESGLRLIKPFRVRNKASKV